MQRLRRGLGELPADLTRVLPGTAEGGSRYAGRGYGGGSTAAGVPARANIGIQNKRTVAGSIQMAPGRADRSYLAIQNHSATQDIWYQFGVDAGLNAGLVIPPGGADIWEVVIPVGSIYVFCATAGQGVGIAEGVPAGAELGFQATVGSGELPAAVSAAPAPTGLLRLRRPSGGGGGQPLVIRSAGTPNPAEWTSIGGHYYQHKWRTK